MAKANYLRGKACIVGAVDEVSPTGELHMTERELEVKLVHAALADAGLKLSDVDGLFVTGMMMPSMELAEHLGIRPRYTDTTMTGGSSFEVHVQHAAAAIALGLCEVAVSVYAQTPRSKGGLGGGMAAMMSSIDRKNPPPFLEWEMPYGLMLPAGAYALAAMRHKHLYGTTSEQLAQIAVSTRQWAEKNPRARYQEPLTISDVMNSPLVCDPLHRYDCCLVTDGAGAVVITSAERAKSLKKKPVYILGTGVSHDHAMMITEMPELTVTPGAVSAKQAFEHAGYKPKDIDLVMTYDSFTITVLMSLEDMGFCAKGEGGAFVEDGKLGPGGSLPTNTSGGGLSYTHPGMYGMFLLVEAVRQLRGECGPRQVKNAKLAVAHGVGGVLSACSTVILGTEETL